MSIWESSVESPLLVAARVISGVLDETSETDPHLSSAQRHDVLVELDRCLGRLDAGHPGARPAAETQVRRAAEGGRLTWAQAAVLMHALVALAPDSDREPLMPFSLVE